jgi:hypothetical protein
LEQVLGISITILLSISNFWLLAVVFRRSDNLE